MSQIQEKLIAIDATEIVQHPKVQVTMKAPVNAPLNIKAESSAQQTIPDVNIKTQIVATSIQSNFPGKEIASKVFNVLNWTSTIGQVVQ